MNFDVYYPFTNKEGKRCPGIKPVPTDFERLYDIAERGDYPAILKEIGEGRKERKTELPSVCWVGTCNATRKRESMTPTGWVMIDIDHVADPRGAWSGLSKRMGADYLAAHVLTAHVTPSRHGLRIILKAIEGVTDIEACMAQYNELWHFDELGDFDTACKDLSRISFLVPRDYVLYKNDSDLGKAHPKSDLVNPCKEEPGGTKGGKTLAVSGKDQPETIDEFTDEERQQFEAMEWRGVNVRAIIDKFVEVNGKPSSGEIHNYYNEMVKDFRCLTSNNKRCLLYLLPRFGHSAQECWDSIKSICRVNTLSTLEKNFYFFLKDNGFYRTRKESALPLKEYMMDDKAEEKLQRPWMPPVIRELVSTAPDDFVLPAINALLPIMGTLTSYVKAIYPYDGREHTTSFFSIVYAPPGTGKGFVERFMDLMFGDLRRRDYVQSKREEIYLNVLSRKGDNEKSPERPHVSLRLMPPKNSESEFLEKQRDNQGYHMFTFAAEMDSWAKGVKAAGGNKDDMIRIAWDNGEYGQQFKSATTFKGMVNLYWNVLILGTRQQIENYFKNVENGLVTRCCFTAIEHQEFALPSVWKTLTAAKKAVVEQFVKRCDDNTYESPCTLSQEDVDTVPARDFDKEIDWRFKFRQRKLVDMSWIMPVIDKFHREQVRLAAKDVDKARDVFRRRVGVRGFRLALLCTCLWANPRKSDLEKCKEFVSWWMEQDLNGMMQLWGQKYNEQADVAPNLSQRSVFASLGETFTRSDMYVVCTRQGIKSPLRQIIYDWKKFGYIEKIDKDTFKKKQQ